MTLINDFLSLIYPRYCEACDALLYKHEQMICTQCLLLLPKSNFHVSENNTVMKMLAGRVPLRHCACMYIFEKGGKVQQLLHHIKYEGQKELAKKLGELLFEETRNSEIMVNTDVIVPVPLHAKKLALRGYNQSEWFARGISAKSGKPAITNELIRIKESSTQTRKHKFERWENVDGIFGIQKPEAFENKHILLVDDVITTGATLEAVWQALKHIPGIQVSAAAIAFAEK